MVVTQNRKFYVSGQVKTPGAYAYGEGLSVQKAITMAGGFTEKSDKSGRQGCGDAAARRRCCRMLRQRFFLRLRIAI